MMDDVGTQKGRTCAITGSSGYLGSRIKAYLHDKGWIVYGLNRRPASGILRAERTIPFSLGQDIDAGRLSNIEVLIHCAYDFRLVTWEEIVDVNVKGSVKLFEAAEQAGVKRIIFISSMSAFEGCKSLYGKTKLEIEKEASKRGALIVRPGLTFGKHPGGMVGALQKVLSVSPIVPLAGSGNQVLYLAHERDLSQLILVLCQEDHPEVSKPVLAACKRGMSFRQILEVLAAVRGTRPILVPIPWRLVWAGLKGLEIIGLRPSFRSDSIVSLVNQDTAPSFEMTERLSVPFREFCLETVLQG
jgi:nucleoside-diphosphate-sugar epimerase